MAKKTVATLQTSSKKLTKAIKMIKSPKSGAYTFSEAIMSSDQVNDWFERDIKTTIKDCNLLFSQFDNLPEDIQHVLANMCFQLGRTGLSRFKNMNAGVEQEAWGVVSLEMMDSRWAQQTPERATRLRDRVLVMMDDLEG